MLSTNSAGFVPTPDSVSPASSVSSTLASSSDALLVTLISLSFAITSFSSAYTTPDVADVNVTAATANPHNIFDKYLVFMSLHSSIILMLII